MPSRPFAASLSYHGLKGGSEMNLEYAIPRFSDAGGDFRGTSWGMSKEDVRCSEGLFPLSEGEGYITYRECVMGLDAVVGYHFLERLARGGGLRVQGTPRCRARIHTRILEGEGHAHGILRGAVIRRGRVRGMRRFLRPVLRGGVPEACPLIYLSEWTTLRSVIRLVLMGEGSGFDFGLLHRSREHDRLIERGVRRD